MLKLMRPYFIENYIPLFISRQYKSVENLEECDIIVKIIGYIVTVKAKVSRDSEGYKVIK